jgi:O-antigen ligase
MKPRAIIGLFAELSAWSALAYFLVLRASVRAPILLGVIGALFIVRFVLWRMEPAARNIAVIFPCEVFAPLLLWSVVFGACYALSLVPPLGEMRVWLMAFGAITLSVIVNIARHAAHLRFNTHLIAFVLIGVWLLLGAALALSGALTAQWIFFKVPLIQRIMGDNQAIRAVNLPNDQVTNVNIISGLLSALAWMPFVMIVALRSAHVARAIKLIAYAALVLLGVILVGLMLLTQSFGGYGALLVSLITLLALRYKKARWLLVALAVGALIFAAINLPRMMRMSPDELATFTRGRYWVWLRAINMLRDLPLTGVGVGMFAYASKLLYPALLGNEPWQPHSHNLILEIGLDSGVLGILAFAWLQWRVWRIGLAAIRDNANATLAWLIRGLLAGNAGWLMFNLTDLAYLATRAGFVYWSLWALALTLSQIAAKIKHIDRVASTA